MKAKQAAVKKYTATQINMLVERMVLENCDRAEKLATPLYKAWETEAKKKRDSVIHTMTASASMRTLLKGVLRINSECVQKAFGLKKEPYEAGYHLRRKIEKLGEDFKFNLTMADAGDYEKHMKEFAAAVDKLLK